MAHWGELLAGQLKECLGGRAEGGARVVGGRLNEDPLDPQLGANPLIHRAVKRHTSGEA
jgi:hypothetical protein